MYQGSDRLSIIVDTETLSLTHNGPITGEVFIEYAGTIFPEARWSDFPVVILSWWCQATMRLINGAKHEEFLFMDGSFCFDISQDQDTWHVRCFDDISPTSSPITQGSLNRLTFIESLLAAANSVVHACTERSWMSKDVISLSQSLNTLRVTATSLDK
ncbi:hypothetical protein WME95_43075 [Sorangium sp. So ce327]|jgi:hypothetical protein|uniref:hypothetical protein n=1 Tax=Sorangium sp. So ce327 TaxID=3133301 RepID=UPI003F63B8FB